MTTKAIISEIAALCAYEVHREFPEVTADAEPDLGDWDALEDVLGRKPAFDEQMTFASQYQAQLQELTK